MLGKVEYPPLLSAGFHEMTVEALRVLCVDSFPLSKTRADIMSGFEEVVRELRKAHVSGEIWTDGSFLTEKNRPRRFGHRSMCA